MEQQFPFEAARTQVVDLFGTVESMQRNFRDLIASILTLEDPQGDLPFQSHKMLTAFRHVTILKTMSNISTGLWGKGSKYASLIGYFRFVSHATKSSISVS